LRCRKDGKGIVDRSEVNRIEESLRRIIVRSEWGGKGERGLLGKRRGKMRNRDGKGKEG
jgi:hypothetical protein